MSDAELLVEVKRLAQRERLATAQLIAAPAELEARKLYLGEGCSSMFTYCTQVLRLSEHAAYGRIEAARAARRFPIVLELLQDGGLTLTAVTLLAPHLTAENHRDLLQRACHQSKRDVERIVAAVRPQPSVLATVRKLPARATFDEPARAIETGLPPTPDAAAVSAPPLSRAVLAPLAPARYKLQVTIGQETQAGRVRDVDGLRVAVSLVERRTAPLRARAEKPVLTGHRRAARSGAAQFAVTRRHQRKRRAPLRASQDHEHKRAATVTGVPECKRPV